MNAIHSQATTLRDETGPRAGASAAPARKAPGAFRTISEVAEELGVQQHVLRFWETKFSQVKPLKRGGGRRYYRPEDVALLKKIHTLLYTSGYTIKGVQKLLKEKGRAQILAENTDGAPLASAANESVDLPASVASTPVRKGLSVRQRAALETLLAELKTLREALP